MKRIAIRKRNPTAVPTPNAPPVTNEPITEAYNVSEDVLEENCEPEPFS